MLLNFKQILVITSCILFISNSCCFPSYRRALSLTKLEKSDIGNDFFGRNSDTDEKKSNTKIINVKNKQEMIDNYGHILNSEKYIDVVFFIKDTNTFMSPVIPELLTKKAEVSEQLKTHQARRPKFKLPYKKLAKKVSQGRTEWTEFAYDNENKVEYPGYIPVSSCQSQEYGNLGSITFAYSLTTSKSVSHTLEENLGVTVSVFTFSVAASLGISITKSKSISGSTQCTINKGNIGQVLLKPKYLSCYPKSRRAKWDKTKQKFLTDSDFERYEEIHILLQNETYEIECATNDVVDLFCDCELGKPDWDSPLGIDYDSKISKNLTLTSENLRSFFVLSSI
ncbi:uncharacterized protein PRCAT00002560001 [Priceomyces carsonii]|uniref:uncharacterized protein n=1 Tax=Priceomyces carsonii TaxID=28549 RepID=UPI002ED9A4AB|nr:unnamed protein product [Priceomyces carsonii]